MPTSIYILKVIMRDKIEWLGSITGLLGAFLLALNISISGYGFLLFLVSNIAWIIFSLRKQTYALLVQQIGFTTTSLIGVFRWIG